MRDWSAARQHVQKLKASDPRGAERLDKDITAVSLVISDISLGLCCYVFVSHYFFYLFAILFFLCYM